MVGSFTREVEKILKEDRHIPAQYRPALEALVGKLKADHVIGEHTPVTKGIEVIEAFKEDGLSWLIAKLKMRTAVVASDSRPTVERRA